MQGAPTAAGVLLIRTDGRVLAVTRGDDPHDWGLPFGACDPEEAPEACAIRETREETGLEVFDLIELYRGRAYTRVGVTYLARHRGTLRPSEEGRPAWVDLDTLLHPRCSYSAYNREVVRALLARSAQLLPLAAE